MPRFGWGLPVAGLAISVGGLMGGVLSGQSPPLGPPHAWSAVELLSPEFEPVAELPFQTPALETGPHREASARGESVSWQPPIIEPMSLTPSSNSLWPAVVPGPRFVPSDRPFEPVMESEVVPAEFPADSPPMVQVPEPDWMQGLPHPTFEAISLPVPSALNEEANGLPPLPNPMRPGPGHSRSEVSDRPRPGHTAPKRPSESALGLRFW